jgi:hypothetical protein
MIIIAFEDGTVEEYDLDDQTDTRTLDYKLSARIRILRKGQIITIKGGRE